MYISLTTKYLIRVSRLGTAYSISVKNINENLAKIVFNHSQLELLCRKDFNKNKISENAVFYTLYFTMTFNT
jgi:hypothetical protein